MTETHPQLFCERYLLASPGDLALEAGFGFGTHLEAMEMFSGNIGQMIPSLCSPSALLQLTDISQKRVCTLIWSPDLCNCCPEDTYRSLSSGSQRGLRLQSHRIIYNCTLYNCCLRVWLLISLNLGADWDPPFGTLVLVHLQLLGAIKNKKGCLDNHKDCPRARAELNNK